MYISFLDVVTPNSLTIIKKMSYLAYCHNEGWGDLEYTEMERWVRNKDMGRKQQFN